MKSYEWSFGIDGFPKSGYRLFFFNSINLNVAERSGPSKLGHLFLDRINDALLQPFVVWL